ncbi:hypothetical protein F2Q70_00003843 [Brassica cretica]|uniref:Uncharacterized protein n=1 Tax=Brassica cretica TaxID=69181 RepID=A0A8S9ILU4_BRACR|nr:hypothetical protein F2Q70_00003843 [Brassica cretica]
MSSSSNVQRDGDVKMSDAASVSPSVLPPTGENSSALTTAGAVPAHIAEFLSFQSEMARCGAEETANPTHGVSPRPVVPVEALTPEVLPVCDTVPVGGVIAMEVSEPERPSANPNAAKRKRCTEAGVLPTKASGSGLSSRHRAKFISLIDGAIGECGFEVKRVGKELEESREKFSQLEGKLKVIEDFHSLEEARFESRIGELERDLGKTASSFLKAKQAKASKSSELRRLKRKVKSGEGSMVCVIGEAKEAMRAEFQIRLSRIADSLDSLAAVHVRNFSLAGVKGGVGESYSGIEFLQTPGRTPGSESPLGGTPVPRYEVFRVRSQGPPPSPGKRKTSDKQNLPFSEYGRV